LTDCWSVIDSTHRAREITGHVRGLKKNSPELQVFLRNTENVETFRNIIQHIATEIPQLPENSRPTMGSYAWIHKSNPNQSVTLWLGGASQKYSVTGLVVDTREMKFANNNVFSLSDKDVRLDRVVSSCKEFEDSFDRWLASSDLLVTQEIEPSRLNFGIQMQSE